MTTLDLHPAAASKLNLPAIKAAMDEHGLSAATMAKKMEVSRESVSKWLGGEAVPRPDKLLKLSILLKLKRAQLLEGVADTSALQPQVAFRMSRAKQPQTHHVARARHMGKLLEVLVPHLPFDRFVSPPALKNPTSDYQYLQSFALRVRKEMGLSESGTINVSTLAGWFRKLQAVIVPVLWGHRSGHENAIHIFLPKTSTTWVYLNLDTRLADLKFWLAHELGHTYTFSTLQGDEGEDFADGFAGALLFPQSACQALYEELRSVRSMSTRIQHVKKAADSLEISMVCVAKQLDRYAEKIGAAKLIDDHASLYQVNELSKPVVASKALFESDEIDLDDLMRTSDRVFHSPVFEALRAYVQEKKAPATYVQAILDCSLVDAKQIVAELA